MRYALTTLMMFVLAISTVVQAGTVTFDVIGTNVVSSGETVQFEVSVAPSEQLGMFDSVDMVIGANELTIDSFEYAQSWLDLNAFSPGIPINVGVYPTNDLFVGGFFTTPAIGTVLVGTLTVGTVGLDGGIYDVVVNSNYDNGTSGMGLGSVSEYLNGVGIVYGGVPEPATLVLLGMGGLAVLKRRTIGHYSA